MTSLRIQHIPLLAEKLIPSSYPTNLRVCLTLEEINTLSCERERHRPHYQIGMWYMTTSKWETLKRGRFTHHGHGGS